MNHFLYFAPVILFYFEVTFEGCSIHRETALPSQHQFKKLVKAILQDRVVRSDVLNIDVTGSRMQTVIVLNPDTIDFKRATKQTNHIDYNI